MLEYVSYCSWTRVTPLHRSASRVTGQSMKIISKGTGSIYIPAYSRQTFLCPHPPQHLVMSDFRFANWMGGKWNLTVVFIPISLIINEAKHLLLHYELSRLLVSHRHDHACAWIPFFPSLPGEILPIAQYLVPTVLPVVPDRISHSSLWVSTSLGLASDLLGWRNLLPCYSASKPRFLISLDSIAQNNPWNRVAAHYVYWRISSCLEKSSFQQRAVQNGGWGFWIQIKRGMKSLPALCTSD